MSRPVDLKLEVVTIPVSDFDRSKSFYTGLGWRLDADFQFGDGTRAVQFTPPGSPCSVHFGPGASTTPPGSARGLFLIVSDVEAARSDLLGRGAAVSKVFHRAGKEAHIDGRHPEGQSYASFATFNDPDGNVWLLQEVTARLPGRVDATDTTFTSPTELESALRRAATAHGEHEKRIGKRDEDWPTWYADYIVKEQAGKTLPT
jgi:catechol 2,3-dioxygenase-like lactoylglutathione lyase family enzyme